MPDEIKSLIDEHNEICNHLFQKFIKTLCWTQNLFCDVDQLDASLYWRTKKTGEFYWVPRRGVSFSAGGFIHNIMWSDQDKSIFSKVWNSDTSEPIHYALLREARLVCPTAESSSFLIAFSALELSVKHHISLCCRDAAWLIQNIPSPPIFKILRDYTPGLTPQHDGIWKSLEFKEILTRSNKLTEKRNCVAHKGENVSSDEALDMIRLTESVSYILDFASGLEWAADRMPVALRKELGLTVQAHEGIRFRGYSGPGR